MSDKRALSDKELTAWDEQLSKAGSVFSRSTTRLRPRMQQLISELCEARAERDAHRTAFQQIAMTVCPTSEPGDPEFNVVEICKAIMAGAEALERFHALEAAAGELLEAVDATRQPENDAYSLSERRAAALKKLRALLEKEPK